MQIKDFAVASVACGDHVRLTVGHKPNMAHKGLRMEQDGVNAWEAELCHVHAEWARTAACMPKEYLIKDGMHYCAIILRPFGIALQGCLGGDFIRACGSRAA